MKLVNANVDFMQVFVIINKDGDKCRCECREELIDKERCDKGSVFNPVIVGVSVISHVT